MNGRKPGWAAPRRRGAVLAVAVAVGLVGAVAAVTHGFGLAGGAGSPAAASGPAAAAASGVPATGRVISAVAAGAAGDGHTDDTAALQRALDGLRSGDTLALPRGRTFVHDAVLRIRTAGVTVSGGGTLLATDERASAVEVDADGVTLSGLDVSTAHTTRRWSAPEQTGVWLHEHANVVLTGVTVRDSPSAGIFVQGTQHFTISGVTVSGTRADGIHLTGGARYGLVRDPTTENTGDDGVAVVSYLGDPAPAEDIRIESPHVHGTTHGRGVSVVGGSDVDIAGLDVRDTAAAGLYIACERGRFRTRVPSDVRVTGGTIDRANQDPTVGHGAVLIYNGQGREPLRDVTVRNLTIRDTRASAPRQVGLIADDDGPIVGVVLADLHVTGSGPETLLATHTDRLQFRATGWTAGGDPVPDRSAETGSG